MAGSDPYVGAMLAATWFPLMLFLMLIIIKLFLHKTISIVPTIGLKKLLIISGLWSVSYLLIMYSSPPSRLPVHLQPIVISLVVPISALARYIIIKKGKYNVQVIQPLFIYNEIIIDAYSLGKIIFSTSKIPVTIGYNLISNCN